MKTFDDRDILKAARQAFAPPPAVRFEAELERAVAALRRDPVLELMRAHEAFSEPMTRLQRAVEQLAQAAGWFSGGDEQTAETLGALADAAESSRPKSVEIKPSGDVVIDGQTVPAADAKAAVTEAAVVVEARASEPATKQDLANVEKAILARLEHRKTGAWLAVAMFAGGLARDFALEVGSVPLWERFIGADQQAITATATSSPRLFRIDGDGVRLRTAPAHDAEVRLKLNRGDLVHLVERSENGWALVRAQVSGDSHEQGWVATVYLARE